MGTPDTQQVFLKWNNFENNLAAGFADLLQQEVMVDVTLAVEGKLVQAHKIVLSICSSYFKNMFQVNPCQHPIVILKDVGYQELIDMLDFMYRGEVNVKQQDLTSFLKLAETLKVKGLAGGCSEAPADRSQLDFDTRKDSPLVSIGKAYANEAGEGPKDGQMRKGSIIRKKRKRSSSPMKNLNFKINFHNKYEAVDSYDNNVDRKYSYVNDMECVNIKEERLSDVSFDSFGEEVDDCELSNSRLLPGPSKSAESLQLFHRDEEVVDNEVSDNRLHAGTSKSEESSEVIPPDSLVSRRASKPLSLIWSFFNFDCHENKSECKLCGKVFKACPKTGTASVKYHLHFAHQILRNEGECKYIQ